MVAQAAKQTGSRLCAGKSRSALNLRARHPLDTDHHCLELAKLLVDGAARPSSPSFMAATLVTGLAIDAIEEIVDAGALGCCCAIGFRDSAKTMPPRLDAIRFSNGR
jgi:hypothetical protein